MIWLVSLCLAAQVGYAALLMAGLRRARLARPDAAVRTEPISVVVAVRNESRRIPGLLDALERQTARKGEFVIVDDDSEDGTGALVDERLRRDPRFRLVAAPPADGPRKKSALTAGVAAARGPLLALTDADCRPPDTWLRCLTALHATHPGSVLVGYGPMERRPGFLNRWVRYETVRTALLTASSIGLNRPYMAVGRNLSYPKTIFAAAGGFRHGMASLSGDDDLFVQHVARQGIARIRYVDDPDTFVPCEPPANWRVWLRQKRRHASAGAFYDRSALAHLTAWHGSGLVLWAAPLVLGLSGLGFLAIHLGVQFLLASRFMIRLGESDLLRFFPILEPLYAAYPVFAAVAGLLGPPKRW